MRRPCGIGVRRPRVAPRAVLVGVVVATVSALGACSDDTATDPTDLIVGTASGTAPRVAAEIYAEVLRHNGADVAPQIVTDTYPRLLDGFDDGTVDLFPAFSGTLLADLAPRSTATATATVYDELNSALPQGVSVGDPTTVSDQLQVVVASGLASRSGVDTLSECARLPAGLEIVGDRAPDPGTLTALASAGCRFGAFRQAGSVAEVIADVVAGDSVGLVSPLSTAGTDSRLEALSDEEEKQSGRTTPSALPADQPAIRAQNLVPVFSSAALTREQIKAVNKVAGELTTADLATMADQVSRDPDSSATVVGNWLDEHSL